MALNIKIDIEKRNEFVEVADDLRYFIFDSLQKDQSHISLAIRISTQMHPLIPDVYNLSFGPEDGAGQLNDLVKLNHADYSKTFSTIVFAGLAFLERNPDSYLGIDGSNTARAYLYYRCIQKNYDYLDNYIDIFGINYFIRVFRNDVNETELEDYIAIPEKIVKGVFVRPDKLYNYFIIKLKQK